jgi:hypothetical protein
VYQKEKAMGIKCADGGDAIVGTPFEFENHGDEPCTLGDFSGFLTVATNPVPAKSDTGPGTSSATVLTGTTTGDHEYTASCRKKRGNPKISVSSGKP